MKGPPNHRLQAALGGQVGGFVRSFRTGAVLALAVFGTAASAAAAGETADQSVRADLAGMVEEVVAKTGLTINISRSTPTSVNIDKVGGRDVCAPEARADVERLQRAFDAHKSIYRNIGPALISITDRAGKKTYGDRKKLEAQGAIKGCSNIFVSVHD